MKKRQRKAAFTGNPQHDARKKKEDGGRWKKDYKKKKMKKIDEINTQTHI